VFDAPAERSPSLIVDPGVSGIAEPDGAALAGAAEAAIDAAADAAGLGGGAPQAVGTRAAGSGSVMPAATTPIVTAVWPFPRSVRIAPPVIVPVPTGTKSSLSWFDAALADADGDGSADVDGEPEAEELGEALAPGVPVAPATPPLVQAATITIATGRRRAPALRLIRDMTCPPLKSLWAG
jgi:hypothetical protein